MPLPFTKYGRNHIKLRTSKALNNQTMEKVLEINEIIASKDEEIMVLKNKIEWYKNIVSSTVNSQIGDKTDEAIDDDVTITDGEGEAQVERGGKGKGKGTGDNKLNYFREHKNDADVVSKAKEIVDAYPFLKSCKSHMKRSITDMKRENALKNASGSGDQAQAQAQEEHQTEAEAESA